MEVLTGLNTVTELTMEDELLELRHCIVRNYDELTQLYLHITTMNQKLDAVLSLLQKKPRRNTISEVNEKIDGLLDIIRPKNEG